MNIIGGYMYATNANQHKGMVTIYLQNIHVYHFLHSITITCKTIDTHTKLILIKMEKEYHSSCKFNKDKTCLLIHYSYKDIK